MKTLFSSLMLGCFSTVAAAMPQNHAVATSHGELFRLVFGLLFVLLIIGLLSWLVKRLQRVNLTGSSGFQLIASTCLGTKERMSLYQVGDRYFLIGIAAGSVTLMHDFGDELPAGFDPSAKPSFAALFQSATGKSWHE